jgi:hypothetical protein
LVLIESEPKLWILALTRLLHANRHPPTGQVRGYASLENAIGRHPESLTENAARILAAFQLVENESFFVMAGLVPAIHVLLRSYRRKDVDARHKAGHDEPMGSARVRLSG